ncbi:uncharacterized protein LOC116254395 [Nymphaea colorata]|uniref:uncharacterized protein LOC116254395 n=1 Tax=Nymphaea colorata TaxID=210225 RepID=UPI00129DE9D9|nr:uncharacterized protein LOC116254395 [Nymphaea colorata]
MKKSFLILSPLMLTLNIVYVLSQGEQALNISCGTSKKHRGVDVPCISDLNIVVALSNGSRPRPPKGQDASLHKPPTTGKAAGKIGGGIVGSIVTILGAIFCCRRKGKSSGEEEAGQKQAPADVEIGKASDPEKKNIDELPMLNK